MGSGRRVGSVGGLLLGLARSWRAAKWPWGAQLRQSRAGDLVGITGLGKWTRTGSVMGKF